jgi:peptidoglycan hydrolase-like protein with peptidoglycan-binding domain
VSTAFSFQEEPFEFDHEFEQEEETEFGQENFDSELELELNELDMALQELEAEEEIGGRSRVSVRPPPPSLRPRPQPAGRRPPAYRPRPSRVIRRHPRSVFVDEPVTCICPEKTCPQHGTEYIRWVQSALNSVLGLRLPVRGTMDAATRSAVQRFQEQHSLPVDGIAGPETKEALVRARGGKPVSSQGAVDSAVDTQNVNKSGEPSAMEPSPSTTAKQPEPMTSASEFDFEWDTFDERFEDAEGEQNLSVIGPFANQAYGPQMILDADRTKDLTDAIRAVKRTLSLKDQQRLEKVAFAIAKLGTGENPVKYAGVKENGMFFSASLLKVTLLYASFELRFRLNKLAPNIVWDWKPFFASVASATPSIPDGAWKKMKIDEILRITATSDSGVLRFDLTKQHRADLNAIFANQNQDWAAQACMHRLGYSYVNGALAAAGFDPKTKEGIWYANDLGGGWPQFLVPVATNGKSSVAMTALGMAELLTAMHRGTLIDQTSSQEMMGIMSKGASWVSKAANARSLSFTTTGAKVGHHSSRDAKVSSVKSEGAFLDRNRVPFVAVWQNYPDASPDASRDVINIYRVIDDVLKKWP